MGCAGGPFAVNGICEILFWIAREQGPLDCGMRHMSICISALSFCVPPRTPNPKSQMMNSASLKVLQAVNAIANKGLQTDRAEEALALINVAVAALMGEEVESKAAGDQPEANSSNPPPALPLPAVPPSAPAPPGVHAPGTPLPGEAAPATPMVAPSTPALSDSMAIMPFKGANSSSHPKEYAMYRRFCEKNSSCKEVVKAWESGAELFCICVVCANPDLHESARDETFWSLIPSMHG